MALVEAILLGLLLIVPTIWALGVVADLHRGALASAAAARSVGESVSLSPGIDPSMTVRRSVDRAFAAHGLTTEDVRVRWSAPSGTQRGARATIEISYPVPVVAFPLLGSLDVGSVWVHARHTFTVQRYISAAR